MRSGQRFSYLALEPEETRALNAAYHQRIHRDQSNLIPLDPEAFIQRSSTIGRKENRPSFFASNPPIVLGLELVLGKPGALISPELPSGNVQTAGPSASGPGDRRY